MLVVQILLLPIVLSQSSHWFNRLNSHNNQGTAPYYLEMQEKSFNEISNI